MPREPLGADAESDSSPDTMASNPGSVPKAVSVPAASGCHRSTVSSPALLNAIPKLSLPTTSECGPSASTSTFEMASPREVETASPHEIGGFQDRPSCMSQGKKVLLADDFHQTNLNAHEHAQLLFQPRRKNSITPSPGALSNHLFRRRAVAKKSIVNPYLNSMMEILPEHRESSPEDSPAAHITRTPIAEIPVKPIMGGLAAALHRQRSDNAKAKPNKSNLTLSLSPCAESSPRTIQASTSPASPERSPSHSRSPSSSSSLGTPSPRRSPRALSTKELSPSFGKFYQPSPGGGGPSPKMSPAHHRTSSRLRQSPRVSPQVSPSMSRKVPIQPQQSSPIRSLLTNASDAPPLQPPPVVLPHREKVGAPPTRKVPEVAANSTPNTIMGNPNVSILAQERSPSPAQALHDLHRSLSPRFNPLLLPTPTSTTSSTSVIDASTIDNCLDTVALNRPPPVAIPPPLDTFDSAKDPFGVSPVQSYGCGAYSLPAALARDLGPVLPDEPPHRDDFMQATGLMSAPKFVFPASRQPSNPRHFSVQQPRGDDYARKANNTPCEVSPPPVPPRGLTRAASAGPRRGSFSARTAASPAKKKSGLLAAPEGSQSANINRLRRGRGGLGARGGGLLRTSSMFKLSDYAKASKEGYSTPRKQPTDRKLDSPFDSKYLHSLEVSDRQKRKMMRRQESPLFDAIFMQKANSQLDMLVKREATKKLKKQMVNQRCRTAPSSVHGCVTSSSSSSSLSDIITASPTTTTGFSFDLTHPSTDYLAMSTLRPQSVARTLRAAPSASDEKDSSSSSSPSVNAKKSPSTRRDGGAGGLTPATGAAYVPPFLRRLQERKGQSNSSTAHTASATSLSTQTTTSRGSRTSVFGRPVRADLYDDIIFTDDIGYDDESSSFDEDAD